MPMGVNRMVFSLTLNIGVWWTPGEFKVTNYGFRPEETENEEVKLPQEWAELMWRPSIFTGKNHVEVGLKAMLPNWAAQRDKRPPAESVCVYNHKIPKG